MYEFLSPYYEFLNINNNFIYTFCEDGAFNNLQNNFKIYQGYFENCVNTNLLLPVSLPLEQDGMYMNLEGRYR
jgi:NADH dehydrogenase/NADH:ubiquinone oxidoreductase subunit G